LVNKKTKFKDAFNYFIKFCIESINILIQKALLGGNTLSDYENSFKTIEELNIKYRDRILIYEFIKN